MEKFLDKEPFWRVNEFLKKYNAVEFPVLEKTTGEVAIKPSMRNSMKPEFQKALVSDLNDLLAVGLGEAILTTDGLMLVARNEYEGCYTIQIDTKFKNLDYDPFAADEVDAEDEED